MTRRLSTWLALFTFLVGSPAFAAPTATLRGPQADETAQQPTKQLHSGLEEKNKPGTVREIQLGLGAFLRHQGLQMEIVDLAKPTTPTPLGIRTLLVGDLVTQPDAGHGGAPTSPSLDRMTLAAQVWAASRGVTVIRVHDTGWLLEYLRAGDPESVRPAHERPDALVMTATIADLVKEALPPGLPVVVIGAKSDSILANLQGSGHAVFYGASEDGLAFEALLNRLNDTVRRQHATGLEETPAPATQTPRLDYAVGTELQTELAIQSLKKGDYLGLNIGIAPNYQPFYHQVTGKFSSPALASARMLELQAVLADGTPTADSPQWWPVANVLAQSPKLVTLATGLEERPIQWLSAGQFADDRRFLALAADHLQELKDQLGLTISGADNPVDAIRAQVRLKFTDVGLITHGQRWTTLPVYLAADAQSFNVLAKVLQYTLPPLLADHNLNVVVQPLPLLAEVPPPGLLFVHGKFTALPGPLAERVGDLRELWDRDAKQEITLIELPKELEQAGAMIRQYTAADLVVKAFAPTLQRRLGAVMPLIITLQDRATGDSYTTIWL